jgi:formylmethanofuran dehydrogenase subunit E
VQDEQMRCARCGGIITPQTSWQLTVHGEPVCEPCVVRGTGGMIKPSGAYSDGR